MTCETTEPVIFKYVQNNNLPAMSFVYRDKNGNPKNITGYQFELHIKFPIPKTVSGVIVSPTEGTFEFVFADNDLNESGIFDFELQITDDSNKKLTIQDMKLDIAPKIA